MMRKLGYGPDNRLAVKLSTRNVPGYRDAAVVAISQLREVYVDAELDLVDTANWFPRVMRKDYKLAVEVSTGGLDEPDQKFYENYVCGAERNLTGYCDPETDKLIDAQSMEADPQKRRAAGVGGRAPAGRGRLAAGAALFALRQLHAAARQGADDDDQQPLQRLAHGRCLARPIRSRRRSNMQPILRAAAVGGGAADAISAAAPAAAQKPGGILRMPSSPARPACRSTRNRRSSTLGPMMGVFNNLVMFDQHVKQNSLAIDRARSRLELVVERGRRRQLTFTLRQGVKWHDGKPFTARDVQCTWDLLTGKANEKLGSIRANPGTAISTR